MTPTKNITITNDSIAISIPKNKNVQIYRNQKHRCPEIKIKTVLPKSEHPQMNVWKNEFLRASICRYVLILNSWVTTDTATPNTAIPRYYPATKHNNLANETPNQRECRIYELPMGNLSCLDQLTQKPTTKTPRSNKLVFRWHLFVFVGFVGI